MDRNDRLHKTECKKLRWILPGSCYFLTAKEALIRSVSFLIYIIYSFKYTSREKLLALSLLKEKKSLSNRAICSSKLFDGNCTHALNFYGFMLERQTMYHILFIPCLSWGASIFSDDKRFHKTVLMCKFKIILQNLIHFLLNILSVVIRHVKNETIGRKRLRLPHIDLNLWAA